MPVEQISLEEPRAFECPVCRYVYFEDDGEPTEGIGPGTKWENLPEDFKCPHCRVKKVRFAQIDKK